MGAFKSITGRVVSIENFWTNSQPPSGCVKIMKLEIGSRSAVNFIVEPSTYFVNCASITVGNYITGFYDPNVPVHMIYPPQYRALVITRYNPAQNVIVDYFDKNLISSDGLLQLSIANSTRVTLPNRLAFTDSIANRNLVVIFGNHPQYMPTVPKRILAWQVIVLCHDVT